MDDQQACSQEAVRVRHDQIAAVRDAARVGQSAAFLFIEGVYLEGVYL